MQSAEKMGVVVSGSLTEGLQARLEASQSVEDIRVGKFVVVRGRKTDFFSMVTDVRLDATNQKVLLDPPLDQNSLSDEIMTGTSTFGTLSLTPMLMMSEDSSSSLLPVRTIPAHFSPVYQAEEEDFASVFGKDGEKNNFEIGKPLDMEVPVCLNLDRFVERSNGVFGKSGTGKSFLTRLLLCGIVKHQAAVNLVFDMHSEYGWETQSEGAPFVKGLRQLFGSRVLIFSLDPASSGRRGVNVDQVIKIGLNQIEVDDIALLQDELRLNNTAVESAYLVVDKFGKSWLQKLLSMGPEEMETFSQESGAHPASLSALRRKLEMVSRLGFVVDHMENSAIDELMLSIQNGKHIVLEFGQFNSSLSYLLVANIITRRLHELYVKQTEKYLHSKKAEDEPQKLMITIEEAHKFLNPSAAKQTIFGTIAREMRKYGVTLLVVDQRPSGIDSEVLSQIGTRIVAALNDDHDIDAVFTGVSGGQRLRSVLASLDSREQAMVLGHAVPMAVTIRCRKYDEEFYKAISIAALPEREPLEEFFN